MKNDLELFGLQPEWDIFKDMGRDFIWGKPLTLAGAFINIAFFTSIFYFHLYHENSSR